MSAISSTNQQLGNESSDLVIKTAGRIYIKVKDKYYQLNYKDDKKDNKNSDDNISSGQSNILILTSSNELDSLTYPGDDIFIITLDGKFYVSKNKTYQKINVEPSSIVTVFDTPLTITSTEAPLKITSTQLVKNLNANYLEGMSSDQFVHLSDEGINFKLGEFDKLITKELQDASGSTYMNLEQGHLTINSITTNKLTVNNTEEDSDTALSMNDAITKPTYFGASITVTKVTKIEKGDLYYYETDTSGSNIRYDGNENIKVGGYSIADLIVSAYINNYLDTTQSVVDYINTLTTYDSGIIIDNSDFIDSNKYSKYRFVPKDRSVFEDISYGTNSNCAIKIYDRWFDLINMWRDKDYSGYTYECTCKTNNLKAGDYVRGENSLGKIMGQVVGGTETTVRIITLGEDCNFKYLDYDGDNVLQLIKDCQDSQKPLEGTEISLPIRTGDVLYTITNLNVIGNLEGQTSSVFGQISGYGLISEGNVYLVNPNIAAGDVLDPDYASYKFDESGDWDIKYGSISNSSVYDCTIKNRSQSYQFNEDGSGYIGTGSDKISWNAQGVISTDTSIQTVLVAKVTSNTNIIANLTPYITKIQLLQGEWNNNQFIIKYKNNTNNSIGFRVNTLTDGTWANVYLSSDDFIKVNIFRAGDLASDMMNVQADFILEIFMYRKV